METRVRVSRIRQEACDIKSFQLTSLDGAPLPSYTCGSHIDVHVGGVVRQYSLCDAPGASPHYLIAVKHEPVSRGGSRAMHVEVREGDLLTIAGPRNNFPMVEEARHSLLLAGGIGVTPLLCMAKHLHAAGRSFQLQYFTRSIEHTAFHEELSRREFAEEVRFHYALDAAGLKTYLRKLLWTRAEGAHLYLCGPRPFMDLVEETAAKSWPPDAVHVEYFSADPAALSGSRTDFEVHLSRSGISCKVARDQSIVQAVLASGVQIPVSCEQGVCGTCLTGVLAGIPDHRDAYLTEDERTRNDKMLPCVSRALSASLTLDL